MIIMGMNIIDKPRYLWEFVGSSIVSNLPWKDYNIIDTIKGEIIGSYNSPIEVKFRLDKLNNK